MQIGVTWHRLNGLLDETAQTFVRTSFSSVVRDNWDLAVGLMDSHGRQFAQSSRSVPSFIGTMPRTLAVMLQRYPRNVLKQGDVLISNDGYHGTGHLNDITMIRPVFRGEVLIAFMGSIFHTVDIGGAPSVNARDSYEEGLTIPVARILREGVENEDVIAFLSENLRAPEETLGDIRAQFAAYEQGISRLLAILDDDGIGDLDTLVEDILSRSEAAMRRVIEAVPDGSYRDEILVDGFAEPLTIRCAVHISGSELTVDFAGTSAQIAKPINSVLNYTIAYSTYAVKCALDPTTPNNDGSFRPIKITAPEGCLVNPRRPAPVWARHLSGHYLPPVIFSALAQLMPERVIADCGSPLWNVYFGGQHPDGRRFVKMFFMNGGHGARPHQDGPACLSFPSNVATVPIEQFENSVPLLITEKSLIPDSGGAGKFRGGPAQRIGFEVTSEYPVTMTIRHERVKFPPRGLLGGMPGAGGREYLNGERIPAKVRIDLQPNDRVTFDTPGGGGMGPPAERDAEKLKADLRSGLVTPAGAARDYGSEKAAANANEAVPQTNKQAVVGCKLDSFDNLRPRTRGQVLEPYRVGVDIGGTFTDLVMVDTRSGRLFNEKVLTTADDPSLGVLDGMRKILQHSGVAAEEVRHVIHGTTLVANAVIERRGAAVALITTAGFSDVLEIGTEWRYDTYDLFMEMPEALVPRYWRYELPERMSPDGRVLTALDEDAVVAVARQIADTGVTAVAISLLHGFRNPVHEQRVREIIQREAPDLVLCISSEVMPEIGEYERMSTTICNAYVLPVFERYLRRLTDGLRRLGIDKDFYLMLSDGGTVHESTAAAHPIRLVQSGPAGGVQATCVIGGLAGEKKVLCFDMGGTTAKASLIEDGEPLRTTEFEVARVYRFKKGSGLPLRIPVIDMIEIGAGGGSIASVDHLGLVRAGPESSSADPGPACYGRGGVDATVTDADLVLGYLAADNFLGGDMRLDVEAARQALQKNIATPLAIPVVEAAWAIHETVNENMAQAATIHALEKARSIADYAMLPIGGAGPVHACNVALKLGLSRVLCPPSAGVASALGFLVSPTAFTFVQGGVVALVELDFAAVGEMLEGMEKQGRDLLLAAGARACDVHAEHLAAMRYVGQGYDVETPVTSEMLAAGERSVIRGAFEEAYKARYGRIEPDMPVEIVSWRVIVSGPRPEIDLVAARPAIADGAEVKGERRIYFGPGTGFVDAPVYDRYSLVAGSEFDGPGIFEERESTTVVPPGATARIDAALNLVIDLAAAT